MDVILIIIGIVLILAGLIFCVLPVLPGQILSYLSLVILQMSSKAPFAEDFLIFMAVIAAAVTALDYIVPVIGTKKFGGTKRGVRGSMIGLVIGVVVLPITGIVLGPFGILGIILGPFLGAYIGETTGGQDSKKALRSAFGSFIGFLAGTMMKVAYTVVVAYYFFSNL